MRLVRKLVDTLKFARYGSTRVQTLEERLPALEGQLQAHAQAVYAQLNALEARLRALEADAAQLAQAQQRAAREHQEFAVRQGEAHAATAQSIRELGEHSRRELEALRNQISGLAAALDRSASRSPVAPDAALPGAAALEEGFYPLLEAFFRGSEADVAQRMSVYRERVDAMPAGRIADLGCGRGEWLQLLASWGRDAIGVDSNALVAAELRTRGMKIEEGDALDWLQRQPDSSFAGVTAFHIVEHLPFGAVLRLFMEVQRVLVPGGSLIIETPNPENLEVATQTFWLDPTHRRVLPAALLQLAARYCGFEQQVVLRLHPPEDGSGPGRDYALIAGKAAAQ